MSNASALSLFVYFRRSIIKAFNTFITTLWDRNLEAILSILEAKIVNFKSLFPHKYLQTACTFLHFDCKSYIFRLKFDQGTETLKFMQKFRQQLDLLYVLHSEPK